MAYNLSFGLQCILKDSGVKTFVLSVETGSLQFIKSDGSLNVRSDDDSLQNGLIETKSLYWQKMSQLQNFYIFLHKILTNYQFKIFNGAVTIDFKLLDTTLSGATASIIKKISDNSNFGNLSGMNASVEAILNSPQSDNLNDYFALPEEEQPMKVKLAIKSLCAHIWYSILSFAKDSISQEVSRRRQLRFLISMLESYHKLEMYCVLKKRTKSVTIKSQVTKKILKKSNGGVSQKELTLII
jgi:hypothetical protein